MTHVQAVREVLLAAPAVTALVGARIYAQVAPQGTSKAGPFVVLTLVSAVPVQAHGALPSEMLEEARVQVDCYGREYDATHTLAAAVDDALGSLEGPDISASRESMQDLYDNETSLVRVSADYLVHR